MSLTFTDLSKEEALTLSDKKTDKTRTHAPNLEDQTPKPNKSDRYLMKDNLNDHQHTK